MSLVEEDINGHKLLSIINDPDQFIYFLDFLNANHCGENIYFWRDVELYKGLFADLEKAKDTEEVIRIEKMIHTKAFDIHEVYLKNSSPFTVRFFHQSYYRFSV